MWELGQHRLDFAQLDAIAAQLDLMVEPAQVLDGSVRQPAGQVTAAIQSPAIRTEGIGGKALGGEVRPVEITAGQLHAAQAQFPWDSDGNGVSPRIEHGELGVEDRPPDRDGGPRPASIEGQRAHVHGRFGRPVEIGDHRLGQALPAAFRQFAGKRLPTAEHSPQRAQPLDSVGVQEERQHGGHEMHSAHRAFA